MSAPTDRTPRKKRSIDIGVATVIAAIITAFGAITTGILTVVLPHGASGPQPVTIITETPAPNVIATVTITMAPSPFVHPLRVVTNPWAASTAVVTMVAAIALVILALRWRAQRRRLLDAA